MEIISDIFLGTSFGIRFLKYATKPQVNELQRLRVRAGCCLSTVQPKWITHEQKLSVRCPGVSGLSNG